MRRDARNTGASPIVARYHGDRPWAFRTERGVFSTPVIGGDGTVYVGSADTYFYAIAPDGRLRWRLKTGGIIDAGAALAQESSRRRAATLTFGSADERLYHLDPGATRPRILWKFRPTVAPVKGQQVNWWEGPVAIGPGGNIYAGNTGGTAYGLTPRGRLAWRFTSGGSMWTEPAFAADGGSFWGSLDLNVYHLAASGRPLWRTFTPGFVISSPAIGSDGTVYVGSFDSKLYALDPATGTPRWTFKTSDHIYASPALGHDARGRTDAIYIASADGSVYALTPRGRLRWRYDTGDPVRSSPVLSRAPNGEARQILYVGSSNGKLYALNTDTGRRRWSFDTTPDDPQLRDRNDLNASPALGRHGVLIAGEHGYVDYVPYDFCLHRIDPRCSTDPSSEFGNELDRVFPVSPGGSTLRSTALSGVSPATVLNLRLVVRHHGRSVNAAMLDPARVLTVSPRFRFTAQESGDGHYLYVVPRGLLRPGTTYRLRISGAYTDNGLNMGNFNPTGRVAGHFHQTIVVRTRSFPAHDALPLGAHATRVSAVTIKRLAVPMPAFLPSVNQIGFDSYDWIAATILRGHGSVLEWVIGAYRDAHGVERVD
ncbi:MAG: PQQ-binding-like beta-propeller repeat protein, partial [Solirubrobacterales bacterium]|nr:PQQ-binding-like beta-propeller repeat protein [Solirubrobacterales bacterium]